MLLRQRARVIGARVAGHAATASGGASSGVVCSALRSAAQVPRQACLLHSQSRLARARVIPLGSEPVRPTAAGPIIGGGRAPIGGGFVAPPVSGVMGPPGTISIDRSGLLGMAHTEQQPAGPIDLSHKTLLTKMGEELKAQIRVRGPLSVSDYMFQCLQNAQFGYYTSNQASDVIGGRGKATDATSPSSTGGDFITSPELGQIFGEMIGVWVVQTWEALGRPEKWQLLELGPGRGTLASDVLRTVARFPEAARGLSLHLCETSNTMRDEQVRRLRVKNIRKEELPRAKLSPAEAALQAAAKAGLKATPAFDPATPTPAAAAADPSSSPFSSSSVSAASATGPLDDFAKSEVLLQSMLDASRSTPDQTMQGELRLGDLTATGTTNQDASATAASADDVVPVHWHTKATQVPSSSSSGPLIVLAHEFLDALPVYQFQLTERGWCEKLVDINEGEGPHHFRFVLSAQPTLASRTFLPAARFPTSASPLGSALEIGAAGLAAVEDLCRRLGSSPQGGAALLIDYGTDHAQGDSLQAMRKHEFKHVLEEQGKVDLTTLVDFKSIRATVERTNKSLSSPLSVLPLVSQSHFLRNLNLAGRLEQLVTKALQSATMTPTEVQDLIANAVRLVEPDRAKGGMGAHFKCMAIVSSGLADKENVPFNIPDSVMGEERRAHALRLASAQTSEPETTPTPLPYAATESPPLEHVFSTNDAPKSTTTTATTPAATDAATSATSSTTAAGAATEPPSLASRIELRRAAAREAATALAQARAAREAAAASQSTKP